MADEKVMKLAKSTYEAMCNRLDQIGWNYEKIESDLVIKSGIQGDDLLVEFIVIVDPDTQIARYMSKMPFKIAEEKRIDAAVAVCTANNGLVDGNFDYDVLTGEIIFRMTANFRDTILSGEIFEYMVIVASKIVDKYNDRFLMISKGMMSIEEFISKDMEA